MGKTCEPKAFSFQCMTKFTTNKKKTRKKKYIVVQGTAGSLVIRLSAFSVKGLSSVPGYVRRSTLIETAHPGQAP